MKLQSFLMLCGIAASAVAAPQKGAPGFKDQLSVLTYELIGDGSPLQAYLYKQVSPATNCGENNSKTKGTCSAGTSDIESFTVSADVTANLGAWFSASLGVAKTVGTSRTANCDSNGKHKVCVWSRIGHTGYWVQGYRHMRGMKPSDGKKEGPEKYIWLPNNERYNEPVCGRGDECWALGDTDWGYMSKGDRVLTAETNKGGPQKFVWGSKNEDRWN